MFNKIGKINISYSKLCLYVDFKLIFIISREGLVSTDSDGYHFLWLLYFIDAGWGGLGKKFGKFTGKSRRVDIKVKFIRISFNE